MSQRAAGAGDCNCIAAGRSSSAACGPATDVTAATAAAQASREKHQQHQPKPSGSATTRWHAAQHDPCEECTATRSQPPKTMTTVWRD